MSLLRLNYPITRFRNYPIKLVSRFETIADPRLSNDVACRAIFGLQLLAEVIDEDSQVVGLSGWGIRPDGRQQGPVGYDLVGAPRPVQNQFEFFGTEVHFASPYRDFAGLQVDSKIADFETCLLPGNRRHAGPAQQGANARQEFIRGKRLGDEIVGAGVQGFDLGFFLAPHGKHDNRNGQFGPHAPARPIPPD